MFQRFHKSILHFDIFHLIYFPTPLCKKARCQAGLFAALFSHRAAGFCTFEKEIVENPVGWRKRHRRGFGFPCEKFWLPLEGKALTARHKKPPSAVPIGNAGGGTSFQRGPTTVVCDQSKPTGLAGGCPTIGITLPSSAEAGGLRSAVEHELPKFD